MATCLKLVLWQGVRGEDEIGYSKQQNRVGTAQVYSLCKFKLSAFPTAKKCRFGALSKSLVETGPATFSWASPASALLLGVPSEP